MTGCRAAQLKAQIEEARQNDPVLVLKVWIAHQTHDAPHVKYDRSTTTFTCDDRCA
jgi:hypothetical protein